MKANKSNRRVQHFMLYIFWVKKNTDCNQEWLAVFFSKSFAPLTRQLFIIYTFTASARSHRTQPRSGARFAHASAIICALKHHCTPCIYIVTTRTQRNSNANTNAQLILSARRTRASVARNKVSIFFNGRTVTQVTGRAMIVCARALYGKAPGFDHFVRFYDRRCARVMFVILTTQDATNDAMMVISAADALRR